MQGNVNDQHQLPCLTVLTFSFLCRFFRRGWVTFDRSVNIKEICWNLQNIRVSAAGGTVGKRKGGSLCPAGPLHDFVRLIGRLFYILFDRVFCLHCLWARL